MLWYFTLWPIKRHYGITSSVQPVLSGERSSKCVWKWLELDLHVKSLFSCCSCSIAALSMCIPDSPRIFSSEEAASLGKNLSKQTSLASNFHKWSFLQIDPFVFPVHSTWCSPGNLPFVFSLIMHTYAREYAWIRPHLKETVLWSTITWSVMGKQNIQAKKVHCHRR